ncbi:MAG: 50S ribosomal protein L30 [Bdellovibrionales bacterium]|nr:50S ribosomal protein L30 [Bdellovibrionales bacterium]
MAEKTIRVRQTRSAIGQTKRQKDTLRALGLGRIGNSADHRADASTLGMLRAVAHLIQIEPQGAKG